MFEEEHAPYFFGRDGDVQRLVERVRHSRFVAIVGASGSGKSSRARAGLVPALREGSRLPSAAWPVAVVRPGAHPLEALTAAAVTMSDQRGMVKVLADLEHDERGLHLRGPVRALRPAARTNGRDRPGPARGGVHAERRPARAAARVRQPRLRGQPARWAVCRRGDNARGLLSPAGGASASRAAAGGSARARGRPRPRRAAAGDRRSRVEGRPRARARVAETILDDVGGDPGSLPLLEHALLETWEERHAGVLTLEGHITSGGVHGALARRAEAVFAALDWPDPRDSTVYALAGGSRQPMALFGGEEPARSAAPLRTLVDTDPRTPRLSVTEMRLARTSIAGLGGFEGTLAASRRTAIATAEALESLATERGDS